MRRQRRRARRAEAATAVLGMHPHALDLPHRRRLRTDLGLEHDFAALEPGPRTARRDQPGHAATVATSAVAEAGVDADLTDEHVDRRNEVRVELLAAHPSHRGVDAARRRLRQRHQRLVLAHIAGRAPRALQPLPHRHHQLRRPHQRRAPSRRAHGLVGERVQIGPRTAQRNEIRPCVTQGFVGAAPRPELAADRIRLDPVLGDAGGDHARRHRIGGQHTIDGGGITHERHPAFVDQTKKGRSRHRSSFSRANR